MAETFTINAHRFSSSCIVFIVFEGTGSSIAVRFMSARNLPFKTNGAAAFTASTSSSSGVSISPSFIVHEFCVRKSTCCPLTSKTFSGKTAFVFVFAVVVIIADVSSAAAYSLSFSRTSSCDCNTDVGTVHSSSSSSLLVSSVVVVVKSKLSFSPSPPPFPIILRFSRRSFFFTNSPFSKCL